MSRELIMQVIVATISLTVLDKWLSKQIKNTKDLLEKVLYGIALIISNSFLIIYYMDIFNLPTLFNLVNNIDTQNWLSIITTFISEVISATIGGLIAFGVSRDQIEKNNEQNYENNRLMNMPSFKYDCLKDTNCDNKLEELKSNFEDGVLQYINLSIKNAGLNAARKVYLQIDGNFLDKSYFFELNNQGIIEKNEEKILNFLVKLPSSNTYMFKMIIYYQDLLFNKYKQMIDLEYELFSIKNEKGCEYAYKFSISDEEQITEFPTKE